MARHAALAPIGASGAAREAPVTPVASPARRMRPARRHFSSEGFAVTSRVLTDAECERIALLVPSNGRPGSRCLLEEAWCAELAGTIRLHDALAPHVPRAHVAVQCTCFEKSDASNWLVPMHQDLGISVAGKVPHPRLSGWSEKEGVQYVQAPVSLLRQLVAVRLHLDACGEADGPLKVVPGSHRLGRFSAAQALLMRHGRGEIACPVPRGSAMVMRPLLLHASSKSRGEGRRRVLHFLFGPRSLPFGLHWHHVA